LGSSSAVEVVVEEVLLVAAAVASTARGTLPLKNHRFFCISVHSACSILLLLSIVL